MLRLLRVENAVLCFRHDSLFATATQVCPIGHQLSTPALEDRAQVLAAALLGAAFRYLPMFGKALTMELTRRTRPPTDVVVTLKHAEPRMRVNVRLHCSLVAPKLVCCL